MSANQSGQRANVDDRTSTSVEHSGHGRIAAPDRPGRIDVKLSANFIGVQLANPVAIANVSIVG